MYSPLRFSHRLIKKSGPPIHLTYFITDQCNSRCEYCFYWEKLNQKSRLLTVCEIEQVAKKWGGPLLWFLISGGEPFLRKEIVEICRVIYQYLKPSFIVIPTNAIRQKEIISKVKEICLACPSSWIVIKVSIDEIGERHDSLRGVQGNYLSATSCLESLIALKKEFKNLDVGIGSVFLPQNQDRMLEISKELEKQFPGIYQSVNLVRGTRVDGKWKEVDPKKYAEFFKERRVNSSYRFSFSSLKKLQTEKEKALIYSVLEGNNHSLPCYAGNLSLVLTEVGEVFPCELWERSMGNLRDVNYVIQDLPGYGSKFGGQATVCKSCTHECNLGINMLFNPLTALRIGSLS